MSENIMDQVPNNTQLTEEQNEVVIQMEDNSQQFEPEHEPELFSAVDVSDNQNAPTTSTDPEEKKSWKSWISEKSWNFVLTMDTIGVNILSCIGIDVEGGYYADIAYIAEREKQNEKNQVEEMVKKSLENSEEGATEEV
eukprot:CAMPEP_0117423906 /NCGR_PEP_ID=MMETSP0758-20121206/4430_1 /TAXON_ID=63605 /ORGANISM="Percolomonas cosmopolitus, Strain AE-1 (ATCC 50343)" /LENGTH=138 /DNA_ID=CAMNT_0005207363 /DNA_START=10 /DNA_END=426 /DNA_ORIENTATION=+